MRCAAFFCRFRRALCVRVAFVFAASHILCAAFSGRGCGVCFPFALRNVQALPFYQLMSQTGAIVLSWVLFYRVFAFGASGRLRKLCGNACQGFVCGGRIAPQHAKNPPILWGGFFVSQATIYASIILLFLLNGKRKACQRKKHCRNSCKHSAISSFRSGNNH